MVQMSSDAAFDLSMELDQHIYDEFCQQLRHRYGGVEYEIWDGNDDPERIVLQHPDGSLVEVELEATVLPLDEEGNLPPVRRPKRN